MLILRQDTNIELELQSFSTQAVFLGFLCSQITTKYWLFVSLLKIIIVLSFVGRTV